MRRRYAIPLAGLIAGALVIATGKIAPPQRPGMPLAHSSTASAGMPAAFFDVPDFSLTGQDNKPFTARDLRGKVWIADFIFTGCAGACPVLSEKLSRLQQQISDPRVHFVSFDVDPDRDTPAVLKTYGQKYRADFSRWHFLAVPSREAVFSIARAMHVTDQADDRNFQILHSDNFLLVDAQGKVRGIYDSNNAPLLARLRDDAARLLAN